MCGIICSRQEEVGGKEGWGGVSHWENRADPYCGHTAPWMGLKTLFSVKTEETEEILTPYHGHELTAACKTVLILGEKMDQKGCLRRSENETGCRDKRE